MPPIADPRAFLEGLFHVAVAAADRYHPGRLLGSGGMATVWSATNLFTERYFAIKFLNPVVAKTPEAAAPAAPTTPATPLTVVGGCVDASRGVVLCDEKGQIVDGTISGLAPFGAFVDIGVGKDGLVHVSELAEGRIEKAEDAVTVGQTYTFKVLEVDADVVGHINGGHTALPDSQIRCICEGCKRGLEIVHNGNERSALFTLWMAVTVVPWAPSSRATWA